MGITIEQANKFLEGDLQASAAGYPGANEDVTTYIRVDMLKNDSGDYLHSELLHLIAKENGITPSRLEE